MITLIRTEETVLHDGKEGLRGFLMVGPLVLPTIERLDGYKMLPKGKYKCVMALWTSSKGSKAKALRVLGDYSRGEHKQGRIYLAHPGNFPGDVKGCVLVGLLKIKFGVGNSRAAAKVLWKALGGFELGKQVELEVASDRYED